MWGRKAPVQEDLATQVIQTLIAGKKEALYFSVLLFSLLLSFYYFFRQRRSGHVATLIHLFLFLAAFYGTWTYILRFVEEDMKTFIMKGGDFRGWLSSSNIFFKAYANVINSKNGIWWTSQLLSWAITFGIYLSVEATRINLSLVGRMAYMFLGLLAAIAVTSNIFTTLIPTKIDRKDYTRDAPKIPLSYIISSIVAFVCIYLLPKTVTAFPLTFRVALILLHIAVAFPIFVPLSKLKGDIARYVLCAFYAFLAGASLVFHLINTSEIILPLFSGNIDYKIFFHQLLSVFSKTNDCLTSVSLDLTFCALLTVLLIFQFHRILGLVSLILLPIISPSVLFPLFLLIRELSMIPNVSPGFLSDKRKPKPEDLKEKNGDKKKDELKKEKGDKEKKNKSLFIKKDKNKQN